MSMPFCSDISFCTFKCVLLLASCANPHHRQQVEKRTVLENLDQVMLAMDEIVDGG